MLDIFKKYVNEINYIDFENIKRFFKNIFTGNGIVFDGLSSGTKIRKIVKEVCREKGIENIKQIEMPIIIPAVNVVSGELYVFSNKIKGKEENGIKYIDNIDIGTAVQASCSYPGVFSPCRYKDELFVDGGIAENLPWREAKKAGADKVLSIVFTDKEPKKCCQNVIEILSKSFSILCKELSKYEWDGTDYLLKIEEPKTGLLEKSKLNELYYEGYIQTKNKIEEIKRKIYI